MSLLLLTVTLPGVSNKHCLLSLFSLILLIIGNINVRIVGISTYIVFKSSINFMLS